MRFSSVAVGLVANGAALRQVTAGWNHKEVVQTQQFRSAQQDTHEDSQLLLQGSQLQQRLVNRSRFNAVRKNLYMKRNGPLKNPAPQSVECEPKVQDDAQQAILNSDADLGLLQCADNEHCIESYGSSLGGFCFPEDLIEKISSRELQEQGTRGYAAFCSGDPPADALPCDCTDWDATTESGKMVCVARDSYCFPQQASELVQCPNTCGDVIVTFEKVSASRYSYTTCYDFFSPYEQSFCMKTASQLTPAQTFIVTCGISLDDVSCTECTYQDIYPERRQSQLVFSYDCSNIGLGIGTSTSKTMLPPLFREGASCNGPRTPEDLEDLVNPPVEEEEELPPVGDTTPEDTNAPIISGVQGTDSGSSLLLTTTASLMMAGSALAMCILSLI